MKITMETLSEFLGELAREHDNVHDGTIRLRQMNHEVNEVVHEISYTVTALIVDEEGNGHLIRYAEACGDDVSPATNGTNRMTDNADHLTTECDVLGLKVRPGEIEL